jgi:hypothetical protein
MGGALARHEGHVKVVGDGQSAAGHKGVGGLGREAKLSVGMIGYGYVEVTPIDAQVVAGTIEYALIS